MINYVLNDLNQANLACQRLALGLLFDPMIYEKDYLQSEIFLGCFEMACYNVFNGQILREITQSNVLSDES